MKKKSNNLNIGIIGIGRWGRNIVKTILRDKSVNLNCVYSKNESTVDFVPSSCLIFKDWNDLINGTKLDGIIISTPPDTHYKIAKRCIEANIPILIEKPISLNFQESLDIKSFSKIKNVPVMIEFTQIFNPKFIALKENMLPFLEK